MKNVKLGLFFLGKDEADNLFEAEQTGKEYGSAVDGKCDGKANYPIDIQLFDKECNHNYSGQENENVKPIPAVYFQFQDAFGEEVLKESCYALDAEAGAGRSDRLESRNDEEVQQDIDDHARCRNEVQLFHATIGSEQSAKNVSSWKTEETAHQ